MRSRRSVVVALLCLAGACCCAAPGFAQSSNETGKLKIHVGPKQAYVWLDGKAIRDGTQTLTLTAGRHQVGVYNYGYLPKTQDVQVAAAKTTDLNVDLQPSGDKVAGPFGDIEFKGHPRAAVLLNGQKPDYFVGHVDEFDWNWIWHQRLLVKPGTYQVTITRKGDTVWSGPVTVKAGQQVTVYLNKNGETKTKTWSAGLNMPPQPRFDAGIASATVAVAPVTAELSANANQLSCGQGTEISWKAANAEDVSISGIGNLPTQGSRSENPTHDTTYVLTAKGPGGEETQSVAVKVDATPTVTITLEKPEIHYHKIGARVVEQDSTTVDWKASNANSAKVEPFNSDAMSGSEKVTANPKQTETGPINENVTYTITATNSCGGTITKTATLHLVGSIDPPPATTLASLFFPTAYPTRQHPKVGLIASEKATLDKLATQFTNFSKYEPKAGLLVIGYADVRGPEKYNLALSQRRAALVRDYLVSKGVPAGDIQIRGEGKDNQLDQKTVAVLESQNKQQPENWMTQRKKTTWLAYNRRADLVLEPTRQQSTMFYPVDTPDTHLVWQRPEPSLKKVERESTISTSNVQQARAIDSGK
jgi:outer membrane protein OmpA-like peptidoglycan-associated protein